MTAGGRLLRQLPTAPGGIPWDGLVTVIMVIAVAIVLLVALLIAFGVARYRRRATDTLPPQTHGNTMMEVAWTAAPTAIVVGVFGLTVASMWAGPTPDTGLPPDRAPDIEVHGEQWWWEFRYPAANVVNANVLYIPANRRLLVALHSDNVQHNFWVPELGQKMDMYPGRVNHTWIEAPAPGVYRGVCAEFCGVQHAWMRLLVIALPIAEYEAWLADQQRAAPPPTAPLAQQGATIFGQKACGTCHAIAGTPHQGRAAPDLSHFASRPTISAGVLENTPENLARYLRDPQAVKPGILMPNAQLSDDEIAALVAYLESLP
jgi:cytochrome c oxidase subunit II